jgi:ATP-dependent Zn protease
MFLRNNLESPAETITQLRFEELVNSGQIAHATLLYDPQSVLTEVVGRYYQSGNGAKTEVPFRARLRLTSRLEEKLLSLPQFEASQPNSVLMGVIYSILPIIIIAALIWVFFIRQIKKGPLQTKAAEQQNRYDSILSKWEDQARRMDVVLEKMERDSGLRK